MARRSRGITVAGIDVGGHRKGFDITILRATAAQLSLVCPPAKAHTPMQVVRLLSRYAPDVIAIDSPSDPAATGMRSRACERALATAICGIRYTPDQNGLSGSPTYYAWITNGRSLYAALTRARIGVVIEVFPTASWTRLGGSRVGTRAQWTRTVMKNTLESQVGIKGIPTKHNQDVRDAIVAAYTAWLHHQRLADVSFWPIVVPSSACAEQRAGITRRR